MQIFLRIHGTGSIRGDGDADMAEFKTGQYRCLELLLRTGATDQGRVELFHAGQPVAGVQIDIHTKRWLKLPVEQNETYDLQCSRTEIAIAYLSGSDDLIDTGVRFLNFDNSQECVVAISQHYDTPYRDQYHFMAIKNWMNDPNGLCWFQGRYHMFYQANPFEQKWDDMYWGHAVSEDLLHWRHLPFVLEPQPELRENPELSGGAFSGCAYPVEKENDGESEVYFFLTRHVQVRGEDDTVCEYQTMMKSQDMLEFTKEQVVIAEPPESAGRDFRDPKVSKIGDTYYMVLASNINANLAMLLYSSPDLVSWKYEKPLILDQEEGATTYECPDFFELDGTYVAMAALMKYRDEYGRYQMSRYYIGSFEQREFQTEQTGWLDFGGDFYAVQTFLKAGQRIAIGWTADFHEEHIEVPYGSNGGFALPRVLHVRSNRLCMEPVPEVYELKQELIYKGTVKQIEIEQIEGNTYYAELDFKGNTNFNILLGRNGEKEIRLLYHNGTAQIRTCGVNSEQTRFPVQVEELEHIEIFVDRRTVEVYINRGYAVGTKLFFSASRTGIFAAEFEDETMLPGLELYTMKSVWK